MAKPQKMAFGKHQLLWHKLDIDAVDFPAMFAQATQQARA